MLGDKFGQRDADKESEEGESEETVGHGLYSNGTHHGVRFSGGSLNRS